MHAKCTNIGMDFFKIFTNVLLFFILFELRLYRLGLDLPMDFFICPVKLVNQMLVL